MNIGIITVYNSENSGSFWQAYALSQFMKKKGNDVYFLRRSSKDSSHSLKLLFLRSIKYTLKFNFEHVKKQWEQYLAFAKAQRCFDCISEADCVDCIAIGSDTLWSFDKTYFKENAVLYSGGKYPEVPSFTYAVSAGNATEKDFLGIPSFYSHISNLTGISVRDNYTVKLIRKLFGKDTQLVCDPTMLLEPRDYQELAKPINCKKYILIYSYSSLLVEEIKAIELFAKNRNLKIVSYGRECSKFKWVATDPYTFISYINEAQYIITDTFHGTIFSILFNKSFVDLNRNKNKVEELLKLFEIENRLINNIDYLEDVLSCPIDYEKVNKKRNEIQKSSAYFLEKMIETLGKE